MLRNKPERIKGKRILELGAGVGLTTCVAAKLEPTLLVATDFDSNTFFMPGLACLLSDANHIPPSDLSVRKRKLEDALGVNASFDLILGSDLFWDEEMADLVISTIKELLVLSKDSGNARLVDRPAPVQISARRWTNPQAIYIVEIKLDSED
ncbi:hypothetical protein BCR33DRAFT_847622 [Rhizoclosmatium globosum]|uniref:Uncharacterized protein n=1 Tax=Rhizoclosmatium globosum TaxID=329046 RepID=A0A1Y2CPG1_9FUNG|nr:hypothetical protein BCR33DRAFT_847622 [Rhizoclosmatium globosum]|eukprot:ORY48918.1 hypothetical protein BCR33DRAFT_847622 [Rhizoclosmatium globosum]